MFWSFEFLIKRGFNEMYDCLSRFSKTIDRPAMCMYMGSFIILLSVRIAPFPSELSSCLDSFHCVYVFSILHFFSLQLTVILWPLRRAVKDAEALHTEYSFHSNENSADLTLDNEDGDESHESVPLLDDQKQADL